MRESQREEEPTSKKKKRERRGHGAGSRMSSDDDDGSDDATTFGKEDTQVRQLARRKPGALGVPMMVQMVRQTGETGDSWGTEELEAALRSRVLAGSFFSRVLLSNGRLSMGAQLELKTLPEVMDGDRVWSPCGHVRLGRPTLPRSRSREHRRRRLGFGSSPRGSADPTEYYDNLRHVDGNGSRRKENPTKSMRKPSKKCRRRDRGTRAPRTRKQHHRRRPSRRPAQSHRDRGRQRQRQRENKQSK